MAPLSIDIFSDIVCPWCFIGTTRLDRALAALPEVTAAVTYHPFQLQPDTPPEGVSIPDMLRTRYRADPLKMFATVEAAAAESGLALDLQKQPRMYPTAAAHTLLRHALSRGTQVALSRALFAAYFLDARNIGDPAVLAEIAGAHGFSADEVPALVTDSVALAATRQEAREASARGIRGVPFFVFNGKLAVSGAQPEAAFREVIQRAFDA
jgi:predicted DsbA family dithiol-disulfide isomerase